MSKHQPSLSLCMIVRDEVVNLPKSLGMVADCFDEVIVIDTGSVDDTPALARHYGAKVYQVPWADDFSFARNASLLAASGDWLMWLDADNCISPHGVEQIRTLLDNSRRAVIWCTEVVVPDGDRLLQKRVFPRKPQVHFSGKVHEQLVHPPEYRSIIAPVEITHWGYADKAGARLKGLRNLRLLLEMQQNQPHDYYVLYQLGKTLINLRHYGQALGWLDQMIHSRQGLSLNPGLHYHAFILRSMALARLDRWDEAERSLKDLIGLAPDYGPGQYYLGRNYYIRELWSEAATHLGEFLRLGVSDALVGYDVPKMKFTAALLLGRCYQFTRQEDLAVAAFKQAYGYDPTNPESSLELAKLAASSGRHQEAQEHLQHCLRLSSNNRLANALMASLVNYA